MNITKKQLQKIIKEVLNENHPEMSEPIADIPHAAPEKEPWPSINRKFGNLEGENDPQKAINELQRQITDLNIKITWIAKQLDLKIPINLPGYSRVEPTAWTTSQDSGTHVSARSHNQYEV